MGACRLPTEDLDHVLDHTRPLWEEIRGARLFITGGTGFFGTWILESFAWANQRLALGSTAVVLSRDPESFGRKLPHLARDPALSFRQGDVRDFELAPDRFSHVIHAAFGSADGRMATDPLLAFDTLVQGTRRTLEYAVRCSAGKLLFVSSGAVYGRQPPAVTRVPEEYEGAPDPLDPWSTYGQGKRVAEHLCALFAGRHDLEIKIARGFAFVGPHLPLDAHFAIGNFIGDALHGRPIHVDGDGTPCRSYLHAADLACWLWTILVRGRSCRPYNVGSGVPISIADLARRVARVCGQTPAVTVSREARPGVPAKLYVPSVDRAHEELGLEVRIDLDEAIRRTADWYRQGPIGRS